MSHQNTRREFLKTTTAAGVGYWVAGRAQADESSSSSKSANEKINFASIGVGGKGDSDSNDAGRSGNMVAICDVDDNQLDKAAQRFPNAKKYNDYRQMFDEMAGSIDAVTVSTPDHTHAAAAIRAMKEGKACFTQKPLTHSLWEARRMGEVAREKKVATQMGNQGTANNSLRKAAAIIQSGAIGNATEVHVWTNRPIWPQGGPTPSPKDPPKNLHWDLWLSAAPERPYADGYHPFAWRGWWDFGTGALGDMACHTLNMPFMALSLRDPVSVEAETSGHNKESYPKWSIIRFEFPTTEKRPAVKLTWYDGGKKPPQELIENHKLEGSGCIVVGDKGKLYAPGDYAENAIILLGGIEEPKVTFPESPGHFEEFVRAIRGQGPAMSNFPDYAGPLTETVLLGNLAVWAADTGSGKKIEWDAKNLKATNAPELDRIIKPELRQGFTI
jgi:predicted dehydrogenase